MLWIALAAVAVACASFLVARASRPTAPAADDGSAAARLTVTAAQAEADAAKRQAEIDAREAAHAALEKLGAEARAVEESLAARALAVEERAAEVERRAASGKVRGDELGERERGLKDREQAGRAVADAIAAAEKERRAQVERIAWVRGDELRARMATEWIEQARGAAAERLRRVEAGINDPEHGRTAKRVMTIAVQRYQGHYLTERLLTNVPIPPGALPRIAGADNQLLKVIEEGSHVQLLPSDAGDAIRLDGQDSFGREIARRAISRFGKNTVSLDEGRQQVQQIAADLDREVMDLGKRAFRELEIPRAHPDIVKLVGKLNYRTSYTQNQWKHAIEAAFLCGMMASELRLDVKLARRAALMHDIGKALTHEIDGSHAVIGADLARKLGESEVVANAIGAHHTDEPFNTAYAFLVAASDAMSGARPGARRQQDDNYAERLEELERIASSYQGVERVYAVHGGREVRIHVQEGRISDERAVELSTEIARDISDQLTFPGQIKVTVIREVRASSVAN